MRPVLPYLRPALGVLVAIAITTAMDANDLSMFSALPLLPLMLLFWLLERLPRVEMGFTVGRPRDYLAAVLHPLLVLGAATLVVLLVGLIDTSEANWRHFWLNLGTGSTLGILAVWLTEEGLFRGWLWGSLRRAGASEHQTLVWSSIAFALWHVSAVTLETGFNPPPAQIPVYLANVIVIGLIWGILRSVSGSVLVASVAHAVWNAIAYGLFAFGSKVGALGVTETGTYGPEVGWVGLLLNAVFAAALWSCLGRSRAHLQVGARV